MCFFLVRRRTSNHFCPPAESVSGGTMGGCLCVGEITSRRSDLQNVRVSGQVRCVSPRHLVRPCRLIPAKQQVCVWPISLRPPELLKRFGASSLNQLATSRANLHPDFTSCWPPPCSQHTANTKCDDVRPILGGSLKWSRTLMEEQVKMFIDPERKQSHWSSSSKSLFWLSRCSGHQMIHQSEVRDLWSRSKWTSEQLHSDSVQKGENRRQWAK